MKNDNKLSVMEMQKSDIVLMANYWENADPKFLVSIGVDPDRRVTLEQLQKALTEQLNMPLDEKLSYTLIWQLGSKQVGHSNVNKIEYGKKASIHIHIWYSDIRQKGYGSEFVLKSLPFYFNNLNLENIFCEPYALNPAPNKMLKKIGFKLKRKYITIPGAQNFEQEVSRWELTKNNYNKIQSKIPSVN